MKRALIALIAAVPLTIGTAVAAANVPGGFGDQGGPITPHVAVAGTIVSVNSTAGTFVAKAFVVVPPQPKFGPGFGQGGFGGFGGRGVGSPGFGGHNERHWFQVSTSPTVPSTPTPTQVTISTNASTHVVLNGKQSAVTDLAAGDKFFAVFNGTPSDSIQTLTASPALLIIAHAPPTPKQVFGFVGTVTGVNTTAGTVSVTVSDSLPSTLAPAGTAATFTVGPDTLILGGSSSTSTTSTGTSTTGSAWPSGHSGLFGSLSNVSVGNVVVGVVVAPATDTLTQVEALPLNLLLDFPASSTSTAATRQKALNEALTLVGVKVKQTKKTHHKKAHHHKSAKSHKKSHTKKG